MFGFPELIFSDDSCRMRRTTNNVTFHSKRVLTDEPDVAGRLPGDVKPFFFEN